MSQDYHQTGLFNFSNGFETTSHQQQLHQQHHITTHIRREKLRVQGFEPPPPLVAIEEDDSGGIPTYETAGMLSEMFNFQSHPPSLQHQAVAGEWYRNTRQSIDADQSAATAMQLFLMNPQPRSPNSPRTTLDMLLPHPPSSASTIQPFHQIAANPNPQFSWVPESTRNTNPTPHQGLSLSLSSSLHHLDVGKQEEFPIGDSGILFFNQGGGPSNTNPSPHNYHGNFRNLQGVLPGNHVGLGPSSSYSSSGIVNVLRNSRYVKAAQELLEEFCSVGRGQFKKNRFGRKNSSAGSDGAVIDGSGGGSTSAAKDPPPPLSSADRIEHQRRKVKLLSMLDEVDRRYNHYCEQMQMVVNSFDLVMGFGSAAPYTSLAQKAMSRHFRCLKDAINMQLQHSCELLGEKDVGTSGITKGETPRLKLLEQSFRQQRAFHQMGMMEQEAWRPQRGLPERSVNILRAWLFEHFLHPYPSDADKHLLARQTGLSRNQVSNWFINARVRLWKPMVEDMYQQESKEEEDREGGEYLERERNPSGIAAAAAGGLTAQNPMPSSTTTPRPPLISATSSSSSATMTFNDTTRSQIGCHRGVTAVVESDPSLTAINTHFPENQGRQNTIPSPLIDTFTPTGSYPSILNPDTCRHDGSMIGAEYGPPGSSGSGPTMIRFGAGSGDVSLTLGLRHASNLPEKNNQFSVRDFETC